jgi:hypothetical protein
MRFAIDTVIRFFYDGLAYIETDRQDNPYNISA